MSVLGGLQPYYGFPVTSLMSSKAITVLDYAIMFALVRGIHIFHLFISGVTPVNLLIVSMVVGHFPYISIA